MITSTSHEAQNTGVSTWGFVIFFLLLFWFWGGNGFGGFNRQGSFPTPGMGGLGFDAMAAHAVGSLHDHKDISDCSRRHERDILEMNTVLANQTADISKTLAAMQYEQKAQTQQILEGQKDLYIKELERVALQQYVSNQTSILTNRMDALEANATLRSQNDASAAALQRQQDLASLSSQIANVNCQMVKAPAFIPFGGVPAMGCANYGSAPSFNSCCNS